MMSTATNLVDILRGDAVNAFGDPVDADAVATVGVTFSILEQSRTTTRHADDRQGSERFGIGRCAHGTDLRAGDRLRTDDGAYWLVTAVTTISNPWWPQDVRCDLEQLAPTTVTVNSSGARLGTTRTLPFTLGTS